MCRILLIDKDKSNVLEWTTETFTTVMMLSKTMF